MVRRVVMTSALSAQSPASFPQLPFLLPLLLLLLSAALRCCTCLRALCASSDLLACACFLHPVPPLLHLRPRPSEARLLASSAGSALTGAVRRRRAGRERHRSGGRRRALVPRQPCLPRCLHSLQVSLNPTDPRLWTLDPGP
eukprot:3818666-Rhodomonas_salina.2